MELLSKQKRILVLDNGGRMLSVVDDIMKYGDFDIHIVYDPDTVCDKAKTIHPDLILLDYLLLNNDCRQVCNDLKGEVTLSNVPVIVVSSYSSRKVKSDAYNCDALFVKPMDMEILASRMDNLMAS
jgi:DNA-binding response OmpR family regulator